MHKVLPTLVILLILTGLGFVFNKAHKQRIFAEACEAAGGYTFQTRGSSLCLEPNSIKELESNG